MNCPRQYCIAAQIEITSQKMQSIAMLLKLFFIGFLLVCVNDIARQFDECYLKNSSNSTTKYTYSWGGVIYGEVKKYTYFMIKTYSNIGECNYVIVWSCGLYDAVNVSDCVDSAVISTARHSWNDCTHFPTITALQTTGKLWAGYKDIMNEQLMQLLL